MKECKDIDELIELSVRLYNGDKSSIMPHYVLGLIIDLAKIIKEKEKL